MNVEVSVFCAVWWAVRGDICLDFRKLLLNCSDELAIFCVVWNPTAGELIDVAQTHVFGFL